LDVEAGQVLRTQNKIEAQIKQILDHIEANAGGSIAKRVRLMSLGGIIDR
jgi:hypothetical protein